MTSLKTYGAAILICLTLNGQAHAAQDIVKTLAGCTGRFSAEMEHSWLIADSRADALQSERQTFASVLEAAILDDHRAILGHRIETKQAHASLLTIASFSPDPNRARTARLLANDYLESCRSLILGG
ncbi:hypothetical protein [Shimia haliotis]|nr:hypothetical protein [Shimia haliotis]